MAVVTEYASLDTAVSGTWTTPTNVQADDGATASVTIAAKNTTFDREQGNFGFNTSIPAGATINSVQIEVEHLVTTTGGVAFLENVAYIGGTAGAVNSDSTEPTVLTARTYANYARPGGGSWTRADLLDGTFKTRVRARSGNNATSVTYHWDYIRVTVDYTVPPPSISSASMADADRNWDAPSQDISVTFSEAMTGAPAVGATIPGLTYQKNAGANQALTYRSGGGTATWVVRAAELIRQNNTVVLDYDMVAGAIVAVDDAQELDTQVDKAVTNNLTKRIRVTLKNKDNALITTAVTLSIHIYQNDPAAGGYMARDDNPAPANYTPTAAGLVDLQYSGTSPVGDKVFVVVYWPKWDSAVPSVPTQSYAWEQVID